MKNKILIIGRMGIGKTCLAQALSKELNLPVIDEVPNILGINDDPAIYVSNSISIAESLFLKDHGFSIIEIH